MKKLRTKARAQEDVSSGITKRGDRKGSRQRARSPPSFFSSRTRRGGGGSRLNVHLESLGNVENFVFERGGGGHRFEGR